MFQSSLNPRIAHLIASNFRFVLFKKPNEKTLFLYTQNNNKTYHSGFVICDFLKTQKHFIFPELIEVYDGNNFDSTYPVLFNKIENPSPQSEQKKDKNAYISMINSVKNQLNDDFRKIVLSRAIQWNNPSFNELNHFITLCKNNPNAFNYLIYIPNTLCWMGASPELLIQYKNKKLSTVSLAGTKKKNESWTHKELEEQQIVTEYIIAIFNKYNLSFSQSNQEVISNSFGFEHLKTFIYAENIDFKQAKNLRNELHPTPAVCGLPQKKALETILQIEGYNRSFYTGYVGIENENELELYVNLRCAAIFKDSLSVFVGGGITAKSNPEKEWEETKMKSKVIIN